MCPNCPYCATSQSPCADAFGSNATATGGVLGRVDAVYGAIECQKGGTLHGHFQLFLQCLHQHTPLINIATHKRLAELCKEYGAYNAHVRHMTYVDKDMWTAKKQAEIEDDWPEYKQSTLMLCRPQYQSDGTMEANEWKKKYMAEDVERLQQHKQHHVHLP
eukprot:6468568-Amphidinium_carterae.1